MKYCFIINPASGKKDTKEGLESRIKEAAGRAGADVTVVYTKKAGDAIELAASFCADNPDGELAVIACGGDGTLGEAVNGVMSVPDRERICVGVIPVGTGNDFVRNFCGSETFFDLDALFAATPTRIDLIKYNDGYAVNMINIGFDCQVVVKMADFKAHVPSKLAYICGLVATLVKKPGVSVQITDADGTKKRELLLCTFANGQFCGGGFHSNPNAKLCDGRINALFVNNISRTKFVGLVGSYKSGTHLTEKNANILEESFSERYELNFDAPTSISVDGEIHTVQSLCLECVNDAIGFLVPRRENK